MEFITSFFENVGSYFSLVRFNDVIDMLIIAVVIFLLLSNIRSTHAANILKGVAVFLVVLWLSSLFQIRTVYFVLSHVVEWGILALIILFQPEIRELLERLGGKGNKIFRLFVSESEATEIENAIAQTVEACSEMGKAKTGALIVFERNINLGEQIKTGTAFEASVTSELLKNIFFINAPMHDGATIIRNGRIAGSGCMLPLSGNVNLSKDLGMRHRAGIGMSEKSDAVVVIVSEETGSISVAIGGMLKRHLSAETLKMLLTNELLPSDDEEPARKYSLREMISKMGKEEDNGKDE